jgi:hypothetical protein
MLDARCSIPRPPAEARGRAGRQAPDHLAFVFLVIVVVAALPQQVFAEEESESTVIALVEHLERHPVAEADDVYKFLHQGVFGPGHAIPNPAAAERYLETEMADLEEVEHDEPLCEPLSGDPALVRIHLRPYLAAGRDPEALLEAFVASANEDHGRPDTMARALDEVSESLRSAGRTGLAAGLAALHEELEPMGFPAIHHSGAFSEAYAPAYRVVLEELAVDHDWCERSPGPSRSETESR